MEMAGKRSHQRARGLEKDRRLSKLRTEAGIRERDLHDLESRREYERIRLAGEVAIEIIQYWQAQGLSHADLGVNYGPLVRRARARFQRRDEAWSAEAPEPGPHERVGYRRAQAHRRSFIAASLSKVYTGAFRA